MSRHVTPSKNLFAFAGGGSGGHLFPAIAICEELGRRCNDSSLNFHFLSTGRGVEATVLSTLTGTSSPLSPLQLETLIVPSMRAEDFKRTPIRAAWQLWRSIQVCRRQFRHHPPRAVIGLGGYGSIPGILAARTLRIPTILLEQNLVPGKANRLLSRFASKVCVSFDESVPLLPKSARTLVTGNPVRQSIRRLALEAPGKPGPPLLVILGGSQGARAINAAMLELLREHPQTLQGWRVIHQTGASALEKLPAGKTGIDQLREAYASTSIEAEVQEFLFDLPTVLQQAKLVITRAGGTTLAELAVMGIPAILIPYPDSVDDHQLKNALYFCNRGAAVLVEEQATSQELAQHLSRQFIRLQEQPATQIIMESSMKSLAATTAAEQVVDELLRLLD